jgi:hypothetical protein
VAQTDNRQSFESQRSGSQHVRAVAAIRAARKLFWSPQASQLIEKIDSARENPRKSKSNTPSSKVHFAARARLSDDLQVLHLPLDCGGSNYLPFLSCNSLKTNDRRRFAAENGGKRRRCSAGIRAFELPKTPRGAANRSGAPVASTLSSRLLEE